MSVAAQGLRRCSGNVRVIKFACYRPEARRYLLVVGVNINETCRYWTLSPVILGYWIPLCTWYCCESASILERSWYMVTIKLKLFVTAKCDVAYFIVIIIRFICWYCVQAPRLRSKMLVTLIFLVESITMC